MPQRDIKFKAYHEENGSREFGLSDIDGHGFITMNPGLVEIAQCHVVQWTGLQDNSGKDIYEGDIVVRRYNFPGEPEYVEYHKVVFSDGAFCLLNKDGQQLPMSSFDTPLEVVGNIYDNPELDHD